MSENLNNENEINETPTAVTAGEGSVSEQTPVTGADEGDTSDAGSMNEEQQTFDRKYVEKLRKENAGYREKAKRSEELEQQLHAALVRLDGRLADPADLPFDAGHLADEEALAAAVTELVNRKPGLKAQQLRGDVGAGKRGPDPKPSMDLLQIMRGM